MATKIIDPQTAKNEAIYNLIADHARRAFAWLDIEAGEYSAADVAKMIKRGRARWQYDEDGDELAKAVTVENDGFTCSFRLRDVFVILSKVTTAWRIRTRARVTFIREEEEEQPANVAPVAAAAGDYNKIIFCSIPRPAADEEPANVADDVTTDDDTTTPANVANDDTRDDDAPARVAWLRPLLQYAAAAFIGIFAALLLLIAPDRAQQATATTSEPATVAAAVADTLTTDTATATTPEPANVASDDTAATTIEPATVAATVADTLTTDTTTATTIEPATVAATVADTLTTDAATASDPANVANDDTTATTSEPANVADDDTHDDTTTPANVADDDTTDDDTTTPATDDNQDDDNDDGATTSGTTTANGSTTTTTTTTTTAPATASGSPAPAVAAAGI